MRLANDLKDVAAIVGIGQTEFSKRSGRTELQLAIEAIGAALADCGLRASDVDGMSLYTMENNPANEVIRNLGGGDLRFFSRIHYGGGAACAPIHQAAMAIHSVATPRSARPKTASLTPKAKTMFWRMIRSERRA